MTSHRLRLNDLILSAGDDVPDDRSRTWWWDVYGQDFSTGAAEPIEVTMRTLLQDGARVVTQGYGNREVTFFVVVGGVDSAALAAAEQDLARNLGRRGELGWTPPDGWAPESVFDIETSSMTPGGPDDDDLLEVQNIERVYQLRFVCQPFVRPGSPIVVPAVAIPAAVLDEKLVDAALALTRWTAQSGTIRDRGAFLDIIGTKNPQPVFTPVAPVDISTQPYLSLITARGGAPVCDVNGSRAQLVGSETATPFALPDGTIVKAVRWFWRTDQTSITKAEWYAGITAVRPFQFLFRELRARNLPPYSGTLRQSRRTIEVAGSVRTQGTLAVVAPVSQSLGTLVFYSTTNGTSAPSLRGYRISGPNTPAPVGDAVSGFTESLNPAGSADGVGVTFEIPVADLAAGKCQILARIYGEGGTKSIAWTGRTRIAGANVGPAVSGTTSVLLAAGQYKVVALGTADLPPTDLPEGSQATIRVTLTGGHSYDEVWLMNLDQGALTVVEAGTHRRAWIETATTERPRPAIYIGDSADRSDAFHDPALIGAWGTHEFAPPITNALIVTAGCNGPSVEFEFYPRSMNFVPNPT